MIIAGFGFRAESTYTSLQEALLATKQTGVEALAVPSDKANSTTFMAFAHDMGLPVLRISPEALKSTETATQSSHSQSHRGTGSVAEACALAAAGPQAELITPRHISPDRMATCAIAKGPST